MSKEITKEELKELCGEIFRWAEGLTFDMLEEIKKCESEDVKYFENMRDKFIWAEEEKLDNLTNP